MRKTKDKSTPPLTPPVMLKPREVAEMLKISVGTLANWRAFGFGPTFQRLTPTPKGRVVYPLDKVIEYQRNLPTFPCVTSRVSQIVHERL